jgi:hypothetical protein
MLDEEVVWVTVVSDPVVGRTGAAGDTVVDVDVGDEVDSDVVLLVEVEVEVEVEVLVDDKEVELEVGTVGAVETVEDEIKVVELPTTVYVDI